jgi:hypothetical protein
VDLTKEREKNEQIKQMVQSVIKLTVGVSSVTMVYYILKTTVGSETNVTSYLSSSRPLLQLRADLSVSEGVGNAVSLSLDQGHVVCLLTMYMVLGTLTLTRLVQHNERGHRGGRQRAMTPIVVTSLLPITMAVENT